MDPWLSEHCTCPMCKLNILKALGIVVCCLFCEVSSLSVTEQHKWTVTSHDKTLAPLPDVSDRTFLPAHLRELPQRRAGAVLAPKGACRVVGVWGRTEKRNRM